jgi:uncharacterized protein YdbL (DUF1318 family)
MKRLLLSLAAVLVLSGNGLCLDLQTAKAQGLVGETPTGYLAPVQATHAEAKNLAQSINAQRKKQYEAIARRNNTPLQAVEQLAGQKAMEKTPAGQYIQLNGAWRKK